MVNLKKMNSPTHKYKRTFNYYKNSMLIQYNNSVMLTKIKYPKKKNSISNKHLHILKPSLHVEQILQ